MEFEIIFYTKEDGTKPIEQFIDSLDIKMRAKILQGIKLLKHNGNTLREPYTKPLGNGIFELREQQSSNICRVLYFFTVGKKIILTNGFIKKTNKTPTAEIERAKKYRDDYQNRYSKEKTNER